METQAQVTDYDYEHEHENRRRDVEGYREPMTRAVFAGVFAVASTIYMSLMAIFVSLISEGGNVAHLVARLWAKSILAASRVKVRVDGLRHLHPGKPYVYMANHQSMFDILALLACLPVQFRWLAKKELFQIPVFGPAMRRAGYIPIDRSNRRAAHESMLEAIARIKQGVSVVVFPEGTRSEDGRIQPFKPGGFHLAVRSGRPIVPVVICGSAGILRKGSLHIRSGSIHVQVHPPIETHGPDVKTGGKTGGKTKDDLMEIVREIMERNLKLPEAA